MKITLQHWLELEVLAREAGQALEKLDHQIVELLLEYREYENEFELLIKLGKRVQEAQIELTPSLYWVQSEWTGGDSQNPRNFTLREPNWVTISHAFPSEQVDPLRDENGEIQIPHRKPKG